MKFSIASSILLALGSTSLFLLPATPHAESLPDEPHLAIGGSATVRVVPDTLEMGLRISHVGKDVTEATRSVDERTKEFLGALKSVGIDRKDVGSSELFITPRYNWNNQQQQYVATEVSRRVHLTLRDLSRYADLMAAITKADVGQIDRTTLSTSEEEELRRKALRAAMKDARQKAELLVATLDEKDARVGEVYSVTAHSRGGAPALRSQAFEQSRGGGSFEPGTIELSESVSVVYFIAD